MVVSDQDTPTTEDGDLLTQTCNCCVGRVKALRIVELDCNLGKKKRGFYTLLDGCECRACGAKGDSFSSNKKHSNSAP
ncbi:unnamed protein product [Lymnaea stagnalis]|uniref:CTCK domain-containing protein n=1 Tax=Lymnaea stagnalis TaxID=6523 RepID=A0AAV2H0U0_LYMST